MEHDASSSAGWRFAQCFGDKGEVEDITEGAYLHTSPIGHPRLTPLHLTSPHLISPQFTSPRSTNAQPTLSRPSSLIQQVITLRPVTRAAASSSSNAMNSCVVSTSCAANNVLTLFLLLHLPAHLHLYLHRYVSSRVCLRSCVLYPICRPLSYAVRMDIMTHRRIRPRMSRDPEKGLRIQVLHRVPITRA